MREFVITIIIFGSVPFILMRPHIGILMWTWISMMNPHKLVWGFLTDFPVAALIGGVTIVAWLMSRESKKVPWDPIVVLMVMYLAWTGLTTLTALVPNGAIEPFQKFGKGMVMLMLTLILMRSEKRLVALIWIIVLSIGYYSTKGGIFTLITGGQYRVFGPPGSTIAGNNELAVATLMIMPLMRYLALTTEIRWIRWGLNAAILLSLVSVIGSYSRGAFLAMAALCIVWWWKSKKRMTFGVVAVVVAILVAPLIPSKWYDRMNTIENYEQDGSAQGRLQMWAFAMKVAKDRPILGGGFGVFKDRKVMEKYSPDTKRRNFHSVYFAVLGTQGFVGMIIFLALGIATLRTCTLIQKRSKEPPELKNEYLFGGMLKLSLVAYAVGGAFFNMSTFDLFFLLMGTATLCKGIVIHKLEQAGIGTTASSPSFRRIPAMTMAPDLAPGHSGFRRAH